MSLYLKPIEIALNAAIQQDPETLFKLSEFDKRDLSVLITDFNLSILISINERHIYLTSAQQQTADLNISGTSTALIKLGEHPDNLFSPDIKIHGDVQFAKQLQHLLENFDFDWEQQIARITGDVIAQPLTHGIKQGFSWLKSSIHSLEMTTSEYLREEAQWLPNKIQIEDYMQDIDKLRADIDRLEARIKRLDSKP